MTRYTYLTQYKKTGINSTSCHELSLHTQQKIRRNKFNPCSAMTKYQYIYVLQTNFKPNKNVVKPERVVSSPPLLPVGHLKFDIDQYIFSGFILY